MAGNTVEIVLNAQDGASNTFWQMGREATTMGKSIDTAATTGERSLGKLKTAAAISGAFSVR
jgi:hypothetical protein